MRSPSRTVTVVAPLGDHRRGASVVLLLLGWGMPSMAFPKPRLRSLTLPIPSFDGLCNTNFGVAKNGVEFEVKEFDSGVEKFTEPRKGWDFTQDVTQSLFFDFIGKEIDLCNNNNCSPERKFKDLFPVPLTFCAKVKWSAANPVGSPESTKEQRFAASTRGLQRSRWGSRQAARRSEQPSGMHA